MVPHSVFSPKFAFMVFSRTILGFIMSKEGKVMDPKKVETLVNTCRDPNLGLATKARACKGAGRK